MKYNVIVYAVARVKVMDVDAESQTEAIDKALKSINLYRLLDNQNPAPNVAYIEFGDEIVSYLVDEQGDEEYAKSLWWVDNPEGEGYIPDPVVNREA